jgi:nicotinamidase-related amidase
MAVDVSLDPARTAVLSMDMQAGILALYAGDQEGFTQRAAQVLRRARDCGMTIIHVQVGFRPGFPEIGTRNRLFASIRNSVERQRLFQGEAGQIHPAVAPVGEDIVITKHRVSAFTGTALDLILRAKEIETLVLFGIATSGVVLSTLLTAADSDYRIIVLRDCCADQDEEVHAALLERFFPRRGTVVAAAEFLDSLPA